MRLNKVRGNGGVAKELFKSYFIGYSLLTLIMGAIISVTTILYSIYLFLPSSIVYENINYKLLTDYKEISDEELQEVQGFLIVVNDDNSIDYAKGNIIKELEEITARDYFTLFSANEEFDTLYKIKNSFLKFLESTVALVDLENTMIIDERGVEYSIYYRYDKYLDKAIIFGVPYENINKHGNLNPITGNKNQIYSLIAINISILLGIIYIFSKVTSRKFTKPIKVLNEGMKEITKGNYGNQVEIKKKNEFKELAHGFNLMSSTIREEKVKNEMLQQEKNKLIVHISHDLKNPLAAIVGYSDMLTDGRDLTDEEKEEYLNIISKNSERANKIITDLFEFSLMHSVDYKLNLKKVDVNEVLREILAYYVPELETKEFNYEFDISENEYILELDEVKFTRAIGNLIDNAIKYNNANTTLFVSSKMHGSTIQIIVEDNGKGIDEEVREKIFEAFVREDKARNSSTGGTGLGLSISKAIIEKHNGSIRLVHSGKGTKYIIEFKV